MRTSVRSGAGTLGLTTVGCMSDWAFRGYKSGRVGFSVSKILLGFLSLGENIEYLMGPLVGLYPSRFVPVLRHSESMGCHLKITPTMSAELLG